MHSGIDPVRAALLRKAFRLPNIGSIQSRRSTITNAFVNSLTPCIKPTPADVEEALRVLGMSLENVRCAYCGDPHTEWDHLRPLVENGRPTGFITEIANLVPACGKCNQSKRNAHWKDWMLSAADRSPTARLIPDVDLRIARLTAYEVWRPPTRLDFTRFVSEQELAEYWSKYREVLTDLDACHELACEIQGRAYRAIGLEPRKRRPKNPPK